MMAAEYQADVQGQSKSTQLYQNRRELRPTQRQASRGAMTSSASALHLGSTDAERLFPSLSGISADDPRQIRLATWLDQQELDHPLTLLRGRHRPVPVDPPMYSSRRSPGAGGERGKRPATG
jgi:hypothetical protein